MKTAYQILCLLLVAGLFAANVYRAATQSITADEAFTYNNFVSGCIERSLTSYDANHHVLHTLLCRLTTRWFGLSEFSLRLPSMLGGLLFLIMTWRLARLALGRGWLCLLAVAAVTLNPLVLDYLSAARGYSLALGFSFWGLFLLARCLAEDYDPPVHLLYRAGVVFGISIAANLVFLVPVVAAATVFSLALLAGRTPPRPGDRFWLCADRLWGPGLATAFLIVILPLTRATNQSFYYGAKSLHDMIENLVVVSLLHKPRVYGLIGYVPYFDSWPRTATTFFVPAIAVLVWVAAALITFRWIRRHGPEASTVAERCLLLLGGTLGLSFEAVFAANQWFGVPLPLGRTGVYWPPLFSLAAVVLIAVLWRMAVPFRLMAAACAALTLLALIPFVAGFTTDQYPEWRYDAGTRRIVSRVAELHRSTPGRRMRLGVNWLFQPALEYYRAKNRLDWLDPVTRDGPDGVYDYYVLLPDDAAVLKKRGLRQLYRDPVSDAVLAAPQTLRQD